MLHILLILLATVQIFFGTIYIVKIISFYKLKRQLVKRCDVLIDKNLWVNLGEYIFYDIKTEIALRVVKDIDNSLWYRILYEDCFFKFLKTKDILTIDIYEDYVMHTIELRLGSLEIYTFRVQDILGRKIKYDDIAKVNTFYLRKANT